MRPGARLVIALALVAALLTTTSPKVEAIEGGAAASDMAPSVARLTRNGSHLCTGSVAGDRWILSAYHCLSAINFDWGSITVEIWRSGTVGQGDVYRSTLESAPLSMPGAAASNGAKTGYGDVALLRTSGEMPAWVKTIPMALSWPAMGTKLTEYGYGKVSRTGAVATALQKTPDGDLARVDCSTVAPKNDWKAGHICTKGTRSTAWRGDSGGPLLWWVNGYWQQVGDFSVYPSDAKSVHWQAYWSEADTTTRAWIASHVTGTLAAESIVRDPASGTAWLYKADGYRHWIPDGSTYNCLVAAGRPLVSTWTLRRIETIPDKVGSAGWASCTIPPPSTPPPSVGPIISLTRGATGPAGYWYSVALSGFGPGTTVTVTCRDSVDPQGFWTQSFTINSSGHASDSTLCYSGDHPDHWVTGGGVESNHITW